MAGKVRHMSLLVHACSCICNAGGSTGLHSIVMTHPSFHVLVVTCYVYGVMRLSAGVWPGSMQ